LAIGRPEVVLADRQDDPAGLDSAGLHWPADDPSGVRVSRHRGWRPEGGQDADGL